ncbi:MAG TPA: AAA family ATPase [Candidatus Limnocylindrales bacterium]|nr:AAA family ATPase [Candidatus Limnocylindrales bacterium]
MSEPGSSRAGLALELPEPCLIVLVGAAGSGKSTLAARLFEADQILSSDSIRGVVSGDEADQTATRAAFAILHRELDRRLASGMTTVVDATNVTSFARRSLVGRAKRHGVPAVAIVLDLDAGLVLARNATRTGRLVPVAAVRRQLEQLARSLRRDELVAEGFRSVHIFREPADVEAMTRTRQQRR